MKKALSLLFIFVFIFTLISANVIFYDVDTNTDGGRAIYALSEKGIISGYGNGFFGPEDTLTRAQAVKIINRVFSYSVPAEITFPDVNKDSWYYNDVAIGVNAGYIKGYESGLFGPDDTLTREQICVMLDNIMNFVMLPGDIVLNDEVSSWAEESVKKILSNRLDTLDEKGNYRAKEDITREEACLILSQFVMDSLPEIPAFDLKAVAREELEGRLTRIIKGVREYLSPKTDKSDIKALFAAIADNMENYLKDPLFDYKKEAENTKKTYRSLPKDHRLEAKNLLVNFFLEDEYAEDINILYDFFF